MSDRYVRIHGGPENSNIIGFSLSARPAPKDDFEGFMRSHGYTAEELSVRGPEAIPEHADMIRSIGAVSLAYYKIEPPLREEDEAELTQWLSEHIPVGHNSGWVIDNRNTPAPLQPFHSRQQKVLARW